MKTPEMDNDIEYLRTKFNKVLVDTVWSDNGELGYIIQDGFDLNEYAEMAKKILEADRDIAHDFVGTVSNQSQTEVVTFDYRSGWFLEGIADGEIE
ncbi:hypothetical protein [Pedobacter sp.]|uniref:hypothetical protein n=1 Tax=Pedobacter sp. TaxID=1411316 RepID=UPI003BAD0EE9